MTEKYLATRMSQAAQCSSRNEVLDLALRELPADGLVCEFGVFEAESINYIADRLPGRAVYGFDAFEGLPEHWRDRFKPGFFSTGGASRASGRT